jgi:hypothetical protein
MVPAARSLSMNQGVGTIDPAFDAYPENRDHDGVPRLDSIGWQPFWPSWPCG